MKSLKKTFFLLFFSTFFLSTAQNSKNIKLQNYNTDNWVATDALGRETITFDIAGPLKNNKKVGVFYYVWAGHHSKKVYDITKILKEPKGKRKWGPKGKFHFWGEPEQGYYRSEDPWVLRRDLQMLTNAKVDFLYLDVTNAYIYPETVTALFEMGKKMRAEGIPTPDITFTTNSKSGLTVTKIYNTFYKKGLYKDQWFMWDGKPVIMANPKDPKLTKKARDFFTVKYSWAWTNTQKEPNHWQWLDKYPQNYGWKNDASIPEQIPVSVAGHPGRSKHDNFGNSRSNGKQPTINKDYLTEFTGQGLHFQEQWDRALEVNPEIVMVTQWNEWIAQRFIWGDKKWQKKKNALYAGYPIKKGESWFVDVFTEEFNRDIAPMKDGHTDNYYYQLVNNIRKYKGMNAPLKFSQPNTIKVDGNFKDWANVEPEFYDPTGDTMHRDFAGYDPETNYKNDTGRNDIISAKVGLGKKDVFFYVKTKQKLTSHKEDKWMLLFIDVDKDISTGWEGYDYIVNYEIKSSRKSTLKKWNGTSWTDAGKVSYKKNKNEIELCVSKKDINLKENADFYFKWADNPIELKDVTVFFINGDTAPDRRFKYHFKEN